MATVIRVATTIALGYFTYQNFAQTARNIDATKKIRRDPSKVRTALIDARG